MAYPESCFVDLIGIRNVCTAQLTDFYVDDIPGIDLLKMAKVAEGDTATGERLGMKLIESAARMMAADVEAIYDAQYKVQNQLVGGCSSCSFLNSYSAGYQRGILIKNNTTSSFSTLVVDKLIVKINSTGTFTIILTDGVKSKEIEQAYVAGQEYEIININFFTKLKSVKVYFQESEVLQAKLSCPRNSGSGCGCSGTTAVISDLVYTGLTDGVESQNAWGFMPCAAIRCDASDLLCFVAHSAPRMIGMALLYKVAQLYFETKLQSNRNNKVVGMNTDETKEDVKKYTGLYDSKLNGKGTRGVKDLVFTQLQQTNDVCVVCNSLVGVAWATG